MDRDTTWRQVIARLAEALKRADVTPCELAGLIDRDPATVERILAGDRGISSIELVAIAEALRVEPHWLLTGEPDPHRVVIYRCALREPRNADH